MSLKQEHLLYHFRRGLLLKISNFIYKLLLSFVFIFIYLFLLTSVSSTRPLKSRYKFVRSLKVFNNGKSRLGLQYKKAAQETEEVTCLFFSCKIPNERH